MEKETDRQGEVCVFCEKKIKRERPTDRHKDRQTGRKMVKETETQGDVDNNRYIL